MAPKITTTERNRALVWDFEHGATLEVLAGKYGIKARRVRAILADETNRRRASPDAFYRQFRSVTGEELPPLVAFDFQIPKKPPSPRRFR